MIKAIKMVFPLLWACFNNNPEIVKLLMDYAHQKNITLR